MSPIRALRLSVSHAAILAASFAFLPAAALAQASPPVAVEPAQAEGAVSVAQAQIETVIVTAQKRAEDVQDIPFTVTAISGDDIRNNSAIKTANDIISFVPNANAVATDGRDRPRWFIRGVGTNNTDANGVSPVGVYRDEVYVANFYAQAFPLFDTERVEVLSGPQGTLWGKNTTGGAISYVSRAPTFDTHGYAKARFGSYNERVLEGAVGGSLIDNLLAARVSLYSENQDGWVKNLYDGKKYGANKDFAARLQFLLTPVENLQILASLHSRTYDGDQTPGEIKPDPLQVPSNFAPSPSAPTPYNLGYTPEGGLPYGAINAADPGTENIDNVGGLLRINWEPTAGYALTSITGYEYNRLQRQSWGSGAIPLSNGVSKTAVPDQQWSQEVRLASPREDRFNWIAGLYYFKEIEQSDSASGNINTIPAATPGSAALSYSRSQQKTVTDSRAIFGSATFDVTPELSVTAGARYNEEIKNFGLRYTYGAGNVTFNNPAQWYLPASVNATGGLLVPFDSTQSDKWSRLTYDATVNYKADEGLLLYARYANGFLSGGLNSRTVSLNNPNISEYDPEKLNVYEIGAKTSWFNNRLIANGSLFYYDYPSIQVLIITPSSGANANTTVNTANRYSNAAGWVRGAELSFEALPWDELYIRGSLGLLDTKYTDFPATTITGYNTALLPGGVVPQPKGNQFSRAPNVTLYLGAEYTFALQNDTALKVGGDIRYLSHQYFSPTIEFDPTLEQDAYALVNAHVTWAFGHNERFAVTGSVNNVTDEQYLTHAIAPSNRASSTRQGQPRTYQVTLTAKL